MNYAVSLMYKSERSDSVAPLWEERIILVSALDAEEAELKAIEYSRAEEAEYSVEDSATVIWKFVQVERVYEITDTLTDGAELFSRFLRDSEAKSILIPFED